MPPTHIAKYGTLYTSLICIATGFVFAVITAASDSYTVAPGGTQQLTLFGVCKRITNYSGYSVYVPAYYASEWSSFYSYPPGSVVVSDCRCAGWSQNNLVCDGTGAQPIGSTGYNSATCLSACQALNRSGCCTHNPNIGYCAFVEGGWPVPYPTPDGRWGASC